MMNSGIGLLIYISTIILPTLVYSQQGSAQSSCLGRSCYPATGNLLVGREDNLQASSTCGLDYPERYCVVGDVSDLKKCFICDSRQRWTEDNQDSHNITNIVTTFSKDRLRRWWQGKNGQEKAFIQLDLDAEFHFTHLVITFKTFRPKAMHIERSFDFGNTWLAYRYFAEDCAESFPYIPMGPIKSLKDPVICEEKYSNVLPASGGEVVFKVLPPHMKINDPYSPEVQDLLKLTNLRVIFKELHSLGDDLLQQREINEKYYYAVYDMVVRGSCSCYGHASRCVPSNELDWGVENMVHSKCECTHNTKGKNCDQCADFYNDIPWTPARGKETGECRKCECHDHATSCHFDPAVYHSRGNVSGGVCDNCMHNTDGLNCERCKSHYYQDPARDLRDRYICQPCDCDPVGTQNNGECDMMNDPANGLIAGKCKCKTNVAGTRCERCEVGFWDYSDMGCRECECNTLGTYGNLGCNQYNGDCTCKRYVRGRNCDRCQEQYWGLSDATEGCQVCGCDPGGSYDNFCDEISGQCNCKPGITGRACDQTIPGYYITDLDYLRYEGEYATGTGKSQVVVREPVPGDSITWTGPGFMRVYEKDELTFNISGIPYSMNYDIIIRYETQMPYGWDDVRVIVQRPGSPDPNGPCGNTRPEDDYPGATLSATSLHYIVTPQICLEAGQNYQITLSFPHYQVPDDTPDANILIDAIALMPFYEEIPWRRDPNGPGPVDIIFCNNMEYDAVDIENVPDVCKKYVFSAGAAIQDRALGCNCDPTGSESKICEPIGGQCKCKPNVRGRTCNECTPGAFGFSPSGCSLCNCDPSGAIDNFCDPIHGQCYCIYGVTGRQCNVCDLGMFNFPRCERCQCNNHAETCEDKTGNCIACEDDTTGDSCESCVDGYYGDPSLGSAIPCRKCMCPGGEGSGYQHTNTCSLDPRTKDMICDCPDEFAGDQCEKCAINHYGNPMEANGTCTSCLEGCNYNIDMDIEMSCDPSDGRCTKCQYNTEGDNCELCANGFHGDAVAHSCVACDCNWLGADRNATEPCNRVTGQCPCLPNVIGSSCDECDTDYWKLASGEGCEACDCDKEGSTSPDCNEFDGQCDCIDGRGGRRCNQCVALSYGDPTTECFPCDCNPDGSEMQQCDPYTGQCPCLDGITGMKCDRCDRGTTGVLPNCVPCGECFDNWDLIIQDLRDLTEAMIAQVNATKSAGAVGVYDDQFVAMEEKLRQIQNIIDNFNQSEANMDSMYTSLDDIERELMDAMEAMDILRDNLKQSNQDLAKTDGYLDVLDKQIADLLKEANAKKLEVDELIQEDIIGAYNTIVANNEASKAALEMAKEAEELIDEAIVLQNDTLNALEQGRVEFDRQNSINFEALGNATEEVEAIRAFTLEDINRQVCDLKSPFAEGEFCDAACGGGGCDSCGEGSSCTNGAQGKVSSAITITEQAEDIAEDKTVDAELSKKELEAANGEADTALMAAMTSYEAAKEMSDELSSVKADLTDTLNSIGKLLGDDKATAAGVIAVAEEVLGLSISDEDLEAIATLARQINETIQNLTNIDQILNETAADLAMSERLKQRADNASKAADEILQQVNDLNNELSDAREAQNASSIAIQKAEEDLEAARESLKMIGDVMTDALQKAQKLRRDVEDMFQDSRTLGAKNTENSQLLDRAKRLAKSADKYANQTEEDAEYIKTKYEGVSDKIVSEHQASVAANQRAVDLLERAAKLANSISFSYLSLEELNTELTNSGQTMSDLQKEIDKLSKQMDEHLTYIKFVENFHNKCESAKAK